jgi:hypothetical protein
MREQPVGDGADGLPASHPRGKSSIHDREQRAFGFWRSGACDGDVGASNIP